MSGSDSFQQMFGSFTQGDEVDDIWSTPLLSFDELVCPQISLVLGEGFDFTTTRPKRLGNLLLKSKLRSRQICRKVPLRSKILTDNDKLLQYKFYEKHKHTNERDYHKKKLVKLFDSIINGSYPNRSRICVWNRDQLERLDSMD
ncbi:uncharacterized protein CANTADRAFT_22504 [Suhomyces tanzawaensis NRRL Y-17324]|uniref:Uncharacterized protein n=1 Tax=Suhomyces tanzawaensis NRRL Y-17324 TaxID=984487 RepID=A0A1E4SG77_9ASCO|nr:uncharacterized protein CANTADRAFT_22504 [Suhomyces tanzawaensis NRRL Y-17324]ODV78513.1 hypothetical protein CANTADRAFT_22504 [Suhomyces tanzawaensis NRRL Y-17324]